MPCHGWGRYGEGAFIGLHRTPNPASSRRVRPATMRAMEPLSIGIVGGMSPESTVTYYQSIVRRHVQECGDHAYPRIVVASVSFQRFIDWQNQGEWPRVAAEVQAELEALASARADFALLATNTIHKVLP